MTGPTTSERRVKPRINFQGIVLVRNASEQIPCQALNLSESGILVRPNREVDPGAHVRVTFALPESESAGWVDLQGRLAHCTWVERRLTWGIQFSSVPVEIRGKLREFIDGGLPPLPTPRPGPSASQEVRFIPDAIPESPKNRKAQLIRQMSDEMKELPTRRVPSFKMKRLAGKEDTRQASPEELERIKRLASSKDPEDPTE
jgi:hypothetical protein